MKRVIFVLLFGLFLNNPLFSQIEGKSWQMQNPPEPSFSSILSFSDGNVVNNMLYLNTGQYNIASGVYKLSGSTLVIVMYNVKYVYTVTWYNQNKIALSNSQATLIYGQSGTTEDRFFANYLAWCSINYINPNPSVNSYDEEYSNQKRLCFTCGGHGQCKICNGVGSDSNPYTGTTSVCTVCKGTGKCSHCYGSGYQ